MNILKNKIFRNASWIVVCRIMQAVFNFLISMLTARYLGPSNYGIINYAASIVAFAIPIMQLGLNNILVNETVEHPDEEGKIFGTSILMSMGSSVVCMIGIFAFVSVANFGDIESILTCVLYSALLICQAVEMIQYWYQSKLMSKYVSVVSLIAYVIVSAYKLFLLITGKSVYWFAISNAIDYIIIAIALLIIYKKLGGQRLSFSRATAKRMFSSSKYYIVSGMMVTIFAQTDKIMLKLMLGDTETGYYSAAVTCAGMLSFVFAAIIDSIRPSILENKHIDKDKYEDSVKLLYSIVIYLSLGMSVVITLLAEPIISILYGSEYSPAIAMLRIMVWYTTFSYYGGAKDVWILAEKKQKYLLLLNMSGAICNVILNLILIRYMGGRGACVASLITQFLTNVVMMIVIKPLRYNFKLLIQSLNIIGVSKKLLRRK